MLRDERRHEHARARRLAPAWLAPRSIAPPIVALCAAAGCRGRQSALDPQGPQAARIYELWLVMLTGGTAIFIAVFGLVLLALFAGRRDQPTRDVTRSRARVLAVSLGAATSLVLLIALLFHNMVTTRAITAQPRDPLRIEVVAQQWWWDVTYAAEHPHLRVRLANELHIPVGRPVQITLHARDVIHSFWVPNLHGKLDAIPGHERELWLQADQPGTYRGQCAEFCGLQHAKMALYVVAEAPQRFERWLRDQRRPAHEPDGALAQRGHHVFMQSACAMCHTIRGTPALASAGPDLTHLASRASLAAGTLDNRPGQLGGFLLDPQHVKPGVFMPPNELAGDDFHALLHYLGSLR